MVITGETARNPGLSSVLAVVSLEEPFVHANDAPIPAAGGLVRIRETSEGMFVGELEHSIEQCSQRGNQL